MVEKLKGYLFLEGFSSHIKEDLSFLFGSWGNKSHKQLPQPRGGYLDAKRPHDRRQPTKHRFSDGVGMSAAASSSRVTQIKGLHPRDSILDLHDSWWSFMCHDGQPGSFVHSFQLPLRTPRKFFIFSPWKSCLEDDCFPLNSSFFSGDYCNSFIFGGSASMLQAHDISVGRVDLTFSGSRIGWGEKQLFGCHWSPHGLGRLLSSPETEGAKASLPSHEKSKRSGTKLRRSAGGVLKDMHDENHATPVFWRRFSFNDHPPVT